MIDWLDNLLNKITAYKLMQYYLRALIAIAVVESFFGILPYKWWEILTTTFYLAAVCWLGNWIFSKIFKVVPNYESQFITALILTLIVGPLPLLSNIVFLTLVGLFAMASKYLLVFRQKHLFNPAAFAVLATAIIIKQGASWWVGDIRLLPFVIIFGLIMLYKLRWFHLAVSFLTTYLGLLGLYSILTNHSLVLTVKPILIYSPILFFSSVMLTEPLTAPARYLKRIYSGIFVGVALFISQTYFTQIPYTLELSLLFGNIFVFFVSPLRRFVLKFSQKQAVAQNTTAFSFQPVHKFNFLPGQFLFYTLPHRNADSRGVRRYFTIASSPTEEQIMLAARFAPKSSSFKTALANLVPNTEVLGLGPDGDFVLPKDTKQPLIFLAGGIGITPFRSMIKYLLDQNEQRLITLFYSNKTADEIAFKDLLNQAERTLGLKTVYTLSDQAPANWQGQTGYISELMIRQEAPNFAQSLFFISGPDPFVRAMKKPLLSMGVARYNIKSDYFPGYEG